MEDRGFKLSICLTVLATLSCVFGCGQNKYEDAETGITIRELGSDLDNRWAFKGVVVELVKPGSKADGVINAGELISYVVDERLVKNRKEYRKALVAALEEDGKAILGILKKVPAAATAEDLGIQVEPDPEARGVMVKSVKPGSKAEDAGVKVGTIIHEINGKAIRSIDEYNSTLDAALTDSAPLAFGIFREIVASKLSKLGIDEVEDYTGGVKIVKMVENKTEGTPASMEGIMAGDIITDIIDEMKIADVKSYKKAIKKAADADRVIFKRGELGSIKLVVIDALGKIGDVKAIEPLLKSLESEDTWIRRSAAGALEKMDDQRVIKPLMFHLLEQNEPDMEVRRSAARALARMRLVESMDYLAQALKDSSLGVRLEAGYALARIGEPAIGVLIKARHEPDTKVRDSAVAALGNIGGKLARNELINVLRDTNEESTVKLTAIQALSKIGDSESIAELRKVANTGDPGLRAFIRELLAEEPATQASL